MTSLALSSGDEARHAARDELATNQVARALRRDQTVDARRRLPEVDVEPVQVHQHVASWVAANIVR
jgi:hypothetical protein